ncbi:DUF6011 domain-containing protein [Lysinibacillus irui]|uniref:DUF6011 domain-containing protein n=1 Tax=Lysinibacillus TaxID=400634 RepID=UPI0028A1381E|nr:DUF6011 domain-containing protein [Lysinibacillus sp.]
MHLCERCNRQLKSQKSIDVGMGPTCKKKHEAELAEAEFKKNQITIDEVMESKTA